MNTLLLISNKLIVERGALFTYYDTPRLGIRAGYYIGAAIASEENKFNQLAKKKIKHERRSEISDEELAHYYALWKQKQLHGETETVKSECMSGIPNANGQAEGAPTETREEQQQRANDVRDNQNEEIDG